jgi:hypothetical protein
MRLRGRELILGVSLLLTASILSGQMNYRKGYIVTLKNDTINGLIRDYGYNTSSRLCTFRPDRHSDAQKFGPGQILGYGVEDYKRYTSMEWISTQGYSNLFAEVILEGDLSLYHHWRYKDLAYAIRKENDEVTPLQIVEFNLRRKSDMGQYAYGEKVEGVIPVYRDSLKSIFMDDQKIQDQVGRVEYRVKPIMEITRAYLENNCGKEECITYEKNLRIARDRFGIYGGFQVSQFSHYWSLVESDPTFSYPVVFFYQIPLSYFSDRFSFQLEVLYRYLYYDPLHNLEDNPTYNFAETHILGIPLMFNYRLSVQRFSPVIGIGKELGFVVASDVEFEYVNDLGETIFDNYKIHQINKGGWFLDVGADYELSQGLSLFAKVRVQRYWNKIIYDGVESNIGFNVADGEQIRTDALALYLGIRF